MTTLSLDTVVLTHGAHESREDGVCAMEMVAFLAGEPHSDSPVCTSPVLAAFVRAWNDAIPDDETRTRLLKPVLPRLIGTAASTKVEQRRADLAFDWMVRVSTPAWLDLAKLHDDAAALRALPQLLDRAAVLAAQPAIEAARTHAAAAGAAAGAAARAAAWDAAWDAARDAARAAAWDALKPTVDQLQASALELLDRMIAVTEDDVADCQRTVSQMARHIATKHPEALKE